LKSIDKFLDRVKRRDYNCLDFTREVWLQLCGEDMKDRLDKLINAVAVRRVSVSSVRGFEFLRVPRSPCFVVMQRFKLSPHVGIYLNGKILHLSATGAEYQSINVVKQSFQSVRFCR
jgi:hypothetical protein